MRVWNCLAHLPTMVCLSLLLFLSACATQLAPPYDRSLVEGLTTANVEVMTLFASVSGGTRVEGFANREAKYNEVVGKFDALVLQAGARPMPRNKVTAEINKLLQSKGTPPISDEDLPSTTALKKVSEAVAKMRDTDRKQGVTAMEVQAFKGMASIYLDQALTYENFLQR
ncbi:hypothetical protein FNU76_22300 [Chitinimonas arctica]|uniref:Uncharacterized protein n=1 Tax=Chitinimonas arctica TaxID=2594795 RepID=A0A516SL28_9NEIS|nr:hypothetical protein [Chitinimonas arctica]QDQ28860.1 hypothetical protein FNU76_22300 [Chitinimonas arctica]